MNSSLELDNENLRQKLLDLRKTNSSLMNENHRLIEMLETIDCELRNSSSRIRSLEESIESYRCKSQELGGMVTVFESASKSSEKDCEKLKQKFEECSHQLAESAQLMQSQSVAIESLKMQVHELENLRTKTEAERNLALETAEKIQRSYEELQIRFQKTLSSSKEDANVLHKERTQLHDDLEDRSSQIKALQDDVKNLRAEIGVQKNARRENEQRTADLRTQTKNQSVKIEKLEQDLEIHKKFKVKNGEMKIVMDQQRKRIATLETDIRAIHSKLSQLESLLTYSKKTAVKSRNSTQNVGTLASGAAGKTDRNGGFDSVDLEKLVAAESELFQLRADVLRLAGGFAELSGKDLSGVVNTEEPDKGFAAGDRVEMLENGKMDGFAENIEKRMLKFESMNSRLVSHVANLNAQISELQRKGGEETERQERELQKRTQQIVLLEKQLDEKVQEVATRMAEMNGLKSELERSGAECGEVRAELEARRLECRRIGADMTRLKELHSEHCVELEGQIAMVEKERGETRNCLEQTEARCRALQQSLSQTIDISDALKDDLQSCRQLEVMVVAVERDAREAAERAEQLEEMLRSLRTEFDGKMESARRVEDEYRAQLEERNERVRCCEERLSRAEEQVRVNEDEITRLLEELNRSQAVVRDGVEKVEAVERERSAIQSQVSELKREISRCESSLDAAEEKLEEALEELLRKEHRIAELMRKNVDARQEKVKEERLLSKVEELERVRLELEMELERMDGASVKQQREIEMLRVMLKERETAIEDLQGRVVRAYKELQEKTKTDKHSFAEVEQLKAEAHTKDSQLAEAARKAESQDSELRSCKTQLGNVQAALTQCTEELQRNRLDFEILNEKLEEKEWDVQQKTAKVKQLEQALNERVLLLTEFEQKRLRFEGALQKNQLNGEQHEKQVANLENQVHDLLSLVKEQCLKIQKEEAASVQLGSELDARNARVEELERSTGNLQHELKRTAVVNKLAEQELCASREHLQKMHNELVSARQERESLHCEHDRLAKDLAEAVALLQQKDLELGKLLETLSEAEECRSRYCEQLEQAEEAYRGLESSYHRLMKVHEAEIAVKENENRSLRMELVASFEQQQQLVNQMKQHGTRQTKETQRTNSKPVCTKKTKAQTKERTGSLLQNILDIGVNTDALELSRSTSKTSLSDTCSGSQNSCNSDSVKTRHSERDDHQHFPRVRCDSSSRNHGPCTEVDLPAPQCGYDPNHVLNDSEISIQSFSSFPMQQCEENGDFFQTMWKVLRNSETDNRAFSGCDPVLRSELNKTRTTMCTPVHASDHPTSAINCSAPANNSSALVTKSSTVSHSDLTVYHLAPQGKYSSSSIPYSNSNPALKNSHKSSQSVPHPQNSSKSSDIPTELKQQQVAPNNTKPNPHIATRFSRSSEKPKNAAKRTARSTVNESPFSPIFANRHSPNPTTAISYYERILPASKSDAEVEKITAGRDFCDGGRFSSLSDE